MSQPHELHPHSLRERAKLAAATAPIVPLAQQGDAATGSTATISATAPMTAAAPMAPTAPNAATASTAPTATIATTAAMAPLSSESSTAAAAAPDVAPAVWGDGLLELAGLADRQWHAYNLGTPATGGWGRGDGGGGNEHSFTHSPANHQGHNYSLGPPASAGASTHNPTDHQWYDYSLGTAGGFTHNPADHQWYDYSLGTPASAGGNGSDSDDGNGGGGDQGPPLADTVQHSLPDSPGVISPIHLLAARINRSLGLQAGELASPARPLSAEISAINTPAETPSAYALVAPAPTAASAAATIATAPAATAPAATAPAATAPAATAPAATAPAATAPAATAPAATASAPGVARRGRPRKRPLEISESTALVAPDPTAASTTATAGTAPAATAPASRVARRGRPRKWPLVITESATLLAPVPTAASTPASTATATAATAPASRVARRGRPRKRPLEDAQSAAGHQPLQKAVSASGDEDRDPVLEAPSKKARTAKEEAMNEGKEGEKEREGEDEGNSANDGKDGGDISMAEAGEAPAPTEAPQTSRKRKVATPLEGSGDSEEENMAGGGAARYKKGKGKEEPELSLHSQPTVVRPQLPPSPSPPSPPPPPPPSPELSASNQSISIAPPDTQIVLAGQQQTVVATEGFDQLTAPLLSNIFSHPYANLFTAPVHDESAPGYSTMIHTPRDLKSIAAAVKAGAASTRSLQKSGSAAAAQTTDTELGNACMAASVGTSIVVPATAANTPPCGIVNSKQLEKELFRMFANSAMYNKSTTEIARETVIMANDVQSMMDKFRADEEAGAEKALAARSSKPQVPEENLGAALSGDASSTVVGDKEDKGQNVPKDGGDGGSKKKKTLGATPE